MTRSHITARNILAAFAAIVMIMTPLSAAAQSAAFRAWPVAGSPYSVAVQAPDTVWATLPAQNMVVRLQVSPQSVQTLTYFPLPTPGSEPYGIAFSGNAVWFTERLGNKIGRLDPITGSIQEFSIPTPASRPTGIAVVAGSPTKVWFTESEGNRLGLLTYSGAAQAAVTEFLVPWAGSKPEDVAAAGSDIWFTAPGAARLGIFASATSSFSGFGAGAGSQPWAVALDTAGSPWLTERQGNRVGIYYPQTFSDFKWFALPAPNSDPYDIAVSGDQVAFVERLRNRIALLNSRNGAIREFPLPGAGPTGVAFSADGCVWVAENVAQKLGRWCPPYFEFVYLPLAQR